METLYINKNCSYLSQLLSYAGLEEVSHITALVFNAGNKIATRKSHIIRVLISKTSSPEKKTLLQQKLIDVGLKEKIELAPNEVEENPSAFE